MIKTFLFKIFIIKVVIGCLAYANLRNIDIEMLKTLKHGHMISVKAKKGFKFDKDVKIVKWSPNIGNAIIIKHGLHNEKSVTLLTYARFSNNSDQITINYNDITEIRANPDESSKVLFFLNKKFNGKQKSSVISAISDINRWGGHSWNDAISSIIIPEEDDYIVTLFEDNNFKGKNRILYESVPDLKSIDFNDKVSSIKIGYGYDYFSIMKQDGNQIIPIDLNSKSETITIDKQEHNLLELKDRIIVTSKNKKFKINDKHIRYVYRIYNNEQKYYNQKPIDGIVLNGFDLIDQSGEVKYIDFDHIESINMKSDDYYRFQSRNGFHTLQLGSLRSDKYKSKVTSGDVDKGKGKFIFPDGYSSLKWVGGFKKDKLHGSGVLSRISSKKSKKSWDMKIKYDLNKVIDGTYKKNYRNKSYDNYTYLNNKIMQEEHFSKSGTLKKKIDKKAKTHISFYDGVAIEKEKYFNEDWVLKKEIIFYKNGNTKKDASYNKYGALDKESIFYEDGKTIKQLKEILDPDKRLFSLKKYYQNGILLSAGEQRSGKYVGFVNTYYDNGKLKSKIEYSKEGRVLNSKDYGFDKIYIYEVEVDLIGIYLLFTFILIFSIYIFFVKNKIKGMRYHVSINDGNYDYFFDGRNEKEKIKPELMIKNIIQNNIIMPLEVGFYIILLSAVLLACPGYFLGFDSYFSIFLVSAYIVFTLPFNIIFNNRASNSFIHFDLDEGSETRFNQIKNSFESLGSKKSKPFYSGNIVNLDSEYISCIKSNIDFLSIKNCIFFPDRMYRCDIINSNGIWRTIDYDVAEFDFRKLSKKLPNGQTVYEAGRFTVDKSFFIDISPVKSCESLVNELSNIKKLKELKKNPIDKKSKDPLYELHEKNVAYLFISILCADRSLSKSNSFNQFRSNEKEFLRFILTKLYSSSESNWSKLFYEIIEDMNSKFEIQDIFYDDDLSSTIYYLAGKCSSNELKMIYSFAKDISSFNGAFDSGLSIVLEDMHSVFGLGKKDSAFDPCYKNDLNKNVHLIIYSLCIKGIIDKQEVGKYDHLASSIVLGKSNDDDMLKELKKCINIQSDCIEIYNNGEFSDTESFNTFYSTIKYLDAKLLKEDKDNFCHTLLYLKEKFNLNSFSSLVDFYLISLNSLDFLDNLEFQDKTKEKFSEFDANHESFSVFFKNQYRKHRDISKGEGAKIVEDDNFAKLKKLSSLKDDGILTEDEFDKKKKDLLDKI
jgi:antitoxin component YwqK of YwqJK toxin-antitoxin module